MSNLADTMPFAKLMGVNVLEATPERVVAELVVREDLCTSGGILHGGAAMAFADSLGGIAGFLALPEGAIGTTTIESTAVHRGKRTSVWQTRITTAEGKAVALVIQTQMALYPN